MADFVLDTRLQQDSVDVGNLGLCNVRLMNDARFPWLILVPRVADIIEVHDLANGAQAQLWREVTDTGRVLTRLYDADKLNVGALGNLVPQLHVHVIARNDGDSAWPGPVWGQGTPRPYARRAMDDELDRLRSSLPVTWMMARS